MVTLRTGDRALIRELNTSIVLNAVRLHGPVSRADIARMTGISRSTISGIVPELIQRGLVVTTGSGHSTGGRKPELLAFDSSRYHVVGVKLEPSAVIACLADLDGRLIARSKRPVKGRSLEEACQAIEAAVHDVTEHEKVTEHESTVHESTVNEAIENESSAGVRSQKVLGAGLALPGLVDARRGISVSPHFYDWQKVPFREEMENRLGLPVWIENDARVGSLGEKWAMRTEERDFLFVTVGIGIGASLVLRGHVVDGDLVGAGHLGHARVVPNGDVCHCGLRGCLETVASDAAMIRYAKELGLADEGMTPTEIFALAEAGDTRAEKAVDRVCHYLAIAIGNVVKLLGLRYVVVGGETSVAGGKYFLNLLELHVKQEVFPDSRQDVRVIQSQLGNDVWLVGAAALVLNEIFQPPLYENSNPVRERLVSPLSAPTS